MNSSARFRLLRQLCVAALLLGTVAALANDWPRELLRILDTFPHARLVESEQLSVRDHEIGLGAMEKFSGTWRFGDSERLTGSLERFTWQIVDGFTSLEVMVELLAEIKKRETAELLFACEGRACGHPAQWANRVFGQRVLYGRSDRQRYRIYRITDGATEYRWLIYSAERTADRQYLHVELLTVADDAPSTPAPGLIVP